MDDEAFGRVFHMDDLHVDRGTKRRVFEVGVNHPIGQHHHRHRLVVFLDVQPYLSVLPVVPIRQVAVVFGDMKGGFPLPEQGAGLALRAMLREGVARWPPKAPTRRSLVIHLLVKLGVRISLHVPRIT